MTRYTADVLIVGGGFVGMTLASALSKAGLTTVLVDREKAEASLGSQADGRASAIAFGSAQVLRGVGVFERLEPDAEPILDIRVSDRDSPLFLHYDHRELAGRISADGVPPFGYIIENRHILAALHRHLGDLANVKAIRGVTVSELTRGPGGVTACLSDGTEIEASLVAAADGRNSALRRDAGIPVARWGYGQTAIVLTVAHEKPHRGVAHERFLPAGPFAILPMRGNRSSIVWTERTELVPPILRLDEAAFAAQLHRRFGDFLGRIEPVGPRWSYPLGLLHADRYVDERLVLVGDAAHAIHPIAGQGLNLGIRDVAALAEVLCDAKRLGLDIGARDVVERYQRWRRFDSFVLIAATDSLNRLFSNDIAPVQLVRDIGLAAVNRAPPLKRLFMRHAMGIVGELPRLVRGEAL
ncbi:MAG: UbiH/UbiF/VisC/COQ6 family ubiquinone biosynthesis hydroxylase [Alphaproteobacteria bacterium]